MSTYGTALRLLAVASLAVVAGCGSGTDEPDHLDGITVPSPGTVGTATPDQPTTDTTGTAPGATATGPGAAPPAVAGVVPGPVGDRPAPGTCTALPDAGAYAVADAGVAQVRLEGGRLVLGQVAPADGWTYEVTDSGPDEVEVEFRGGAAGAGVELDFEVEVDNGRLRVEVCADDD